MIQFWIDGNPVPTPRPRITMRGRFAHAYTPATVKRADGTRAPNPIVTWRKAIAEFATPYRPAKAISGPIWLGLTFYFARPQSHYNRGGLKLEAPYFHTVTTDVDNLSKAVMDELTETKDRKGFWLNDAQICVAKIEKCYGHFAKIGCFVQIARPKRPEPMLAAMEI